MHVIFLPWMQILRCCGGQGAALGGARAGAEEGIAATAGGVAAEVGRRGGQAGEGRIGTRGRRGEDSDS